MAKQAPGLLPFLRTAQSADPGQVEDDLMYIQRTASGHLFDEATSSFQKAVRRGQPNQALYWGEELWMKFPGYFWRRLLVIVSEDLSADPMTAVIVGQLAVNAIIATKGFEKAPTGLIEAQAVLIAARAPKSREACDAHGALKRAKKAGWTLVAPDYALDMHTAAGRRLRRSFRHFGEEGRRVASMHNGHPGGSVPALNDWELTRWGQRAAPAVDPDVAMPAVTDPLTELRPREQPEFDDIPPVQ